jgi:2-keto-4-pentenoate hydratase
LADSQPSLGLTTREHRRLADVLLQAARRQRPVAPLTERYPELTLADAARIRDAVLARRVAEGDRLVGARASLEAMPRLSWVTESELVHDGAFERTDLIAPRAGQVIVFRVGRTLSRPEDLLAFTTAVHPGLEILDSRYHSGAVSAVDDLADNCSAAGLYIAPPAKTGEAPDPPAPIAWLASQLTAGGRRIQPGTLLVAPLGSAPVRLDGGRLFRIGIRGFDGLDWLELRTGRRPG